jgi:hypothetical protein
MLMSKRLVVWLLEIAIEALSLGLVLAFLFGYDQHAFGKDLLTYTIAIIFMFFITGYLLTTAISRAFWNVQKLWSYPVLAVTPFLIHFEILNLGVGGAFAPPDRLRIVCAGVCVVFACALAGSLSLRLRVYSTHLNGQKEGSEDAAPASL